MKKLFYLSFLLLVLVACQKSENLKTVEAFYKAQNTYNTAQLEKLIHSNFSAKLWYGEIIQKKHITGNTQINQISNYSVKISKIEEFGDTITLIETPNNDFAKIMNLKNYQLSNTLFIRNNKIFAMKLDTLSGYGKTIIDYEKSFTEFNNWVQFYYPTAMARDEFDNAMFKKFVAEFKGISKNK